MFNLNDIVIHKSTRLEYIITKNFYKQFIKQEYHYCVIKNKLLGFSNWYNENELILKCQLEYKLDFDELLK